MQVRLAVCGERFCCYKVKEDSSSTCFSVKFVDVDRCGCEGLASE